MKKFVLLLSLLVSVTVTVNAQVIKKTIVEHFTNTKCSICASKNPALHSNFNLHPQVLHISIHPSSPYSTCYLSMQNMVDNDARTNYYGVYGGTPRLVINGNVLASSTNFGDTALFTSYAGVSPISIAIEQYAVNIDSILSRIVIRRVSAGSPFGNAQLFAGLIEDTVFGNGGNGEQLHYNVLRKSLFTSQGTNVALPVGIGDSLVVTKTEKYSSFWDENRIATVAILQDATTKQLVQSEISTTNKINLVSGLNNMMMTVSDINIFPNPAANQIILENLNGKTFNYQLINSIGAIVKSNTTNTNRISVSDLPDGIYVLKVFNDNFSIAKKVIVRH